MEIHNTIQNTSVEMNFKNKIENATEELWITGGQVLKGGKVSLAGSSNQVTKCMIASLLTNDQVILENVPQVNERKVMENLLTHMGVSIESLDAQSIRLQSTNINISHLPTHLCRQNRLAILTVGPLLHRFPEVRIAATLGGDKIGLRPVDFHLNGLKAMGAQVDLHGDQYVITVPNGLHGAHVVLPFPSVMTTENLIMAAVLAKGRTLIENAAIEPEIIELVKMLQKMGADIMINANRTYVIQGVKTLHGCHTRIMADRNEAVSLAVAALATGGDVFLENLPHGDIYSFLNFIQRMGATFESSAQGIFVKSPPKGGLKGIHIEVEVHPGFMTDWQQPFMVLFTQANGISVLHETIFEERLTYTHYLKQMGAQITLFPTCLGEAPCRFKNRNHIHSAVIQGPTALTGQNFALPADIRAGMSLIISGLVAKGQTRCTNISEVQRKYQDLVPKLQAMGAHIHTKPD